MSLEEDIGEYMNKNISKSGFPAVKGRIVSRFEQLMEGWNPECHNLKYKRLPYFKGIIGREYIAGFSYVDSEDYERLSKVQWIRSTKYLKMVYSKRNCERLGIKGYVPVTAYEFLHKEILNTDKTVDHIYGLGLDNRKTRLRVSTIGQNATNAAPCTKTGVKNLTIKKGVFKVQMWNPSTKTTDLKCTVSSLTEGSYISDFYMLIYQGSWSYLNNKPKQLLDKENKVLSNCYHRFLKLTGFTRTEVENIIKEHPLYTRWSNVRSLPKT